MEMKNKDIQKKLEGRNVLTLVSEKRLYELLDKEKEIESLQEQNKRAREVIGELRDRLKCGGYNDDAATLINKFLTDNPE